MGSKNKKKALKKQQDKAKLLSSKKQNKVPKATKKHWGILGLILIVGFICFSPSLENEFVNWDDDRNFYENELITSLNNENFWANTVNIFKSDVIGGYNPLTVWTFLLENKFFGLDQAKYWHLNNILLHLVCCMFVFWIGRRLKLGTFGTILLTGLFAIHPMRVESVAWVTERKDVLFGAFYLAAMFYYIRGKQDGFRKRDILIIAACFLLSLLSKVQAVILPISLILIDYYLSANKKITFKSILNKWPLFLASLIFGLINVYFLSLEGATEQEYAGFSRILIGSLSLMVYYIKALVPYQLSPLYPYPAFLDWTFYVAPISFIGTALLLWRSYKKSKHILFFGVGFFIVNVFLLLQIFGAGQGFLADRFTYIPYFGLFFIFAYYIEKLVKSKPTYKTPVTGFAALVMLAYGVMCYQQNKIWKNSGTLWTHVLKHYNKTTLPWGNRANYYRDEGLTSLALSDYGQVIKLKQDKPEPYNSRAKLYFNFANRDSLMKALDNYNKAIELDPENAEYWTNRGATYAKLGNPQNAVINFNKAIEFDSQFANAYLNRSVVYNNNQDWNNALKDVSKYLELKPYHSDLWYEKARLHQALNDYQGFVQANGRAIQLDPNKGLYHYQRARGMSFFNKPLEAKNSLNRAMQLGIKPDQQIVNQILNNN